MEQPQDPPVVTNNLDTIGIQTDNSDLVNTIKNKKMKKYFLGICLLSMVSCQRGCEGFKRSFQLTEKDYHVIQYAADGKILNEFRFRGIVNNSANSDGVYFSIADSTIELSGTLKISYK